MTEDVCDLIYSSVAGAFTGALLGATMIDISDPIVIGLGTVAFGGLTGAIKVLWDRNSAQARVTDAALSECREEHIKAAAKVDTLVEKLIDLSGMVGTLKGRIEGFQEASNKADDEAHKKNHPNQN